MNQPNYRRFPTEPDCYLHLILPEENLGQESQAGEPEQEEGHPLEIHIGNPAVQENAGNRARQNYGHANSKQAPESDSKDGGMQIGIRSQRDDLQYENVRLNDRTSGGLCEATQTCPHHDG